MQFGQSLRHDCPEDDFPHDLSWHFSYLYNLLKDGVNVSTALTPGIDEVWSNAVVMGLCGVTDVFEDCILNMQNDFVFPYCCIFLSL